MPKRATTLPEPIALEDLDRAELLFLIKHRGAFYVTRRDMWRARWETLQDRALAASRATCAAVEAYRAATNPTQRERLWKAYEAASRKAKSTQKAADRAYASLDATAP